MPTRGKHRCQGDEGQILVLALVMLTVVGLLIAGLLSFAEANTKTTPVVRSRTDRVYATDAAMQYALQAVHLNPGLCATSAQQPTHQIPYSPAVNGRSVSLSCQSVTGNAIGASGYAAIIHGSLNKQNGGARTMNGNIYVQNTVTVSGSLMLNNGSLYQSACQANTSVVSFNPSPPFSWQCPSAAPLDPPHVLPPRPADAPPSWDPPGSTCRVHFPGTYAPGGTALNLNGTNDYFVSGIYYFENLGTIQAPTTMIAGSPRPPETAKFARPSDCPTDAVAGGGSGFGVEMIFGGTSALGGLGNNNTLEVFRRYYGVGESGYTERLSFVAVDSSGGGYLASNPANGVVFDASGGHPNLAIHGLFYSRTADVNVNGPNGGSMFQDGLVTRELNIKGSASGSGTLLVNVQGSNDTQEVLLTATATSPGEADVTSTVRAQLQADNTGSTGPNVFVESWRTG